MSMCVVLGTSARIIAASDSRRLIKDDQTGALLDTRDDTCKLALAGPYLLAATGATLPDARAAWRTLPLVPGESARQRLDRLLTVLRAPTTGPAELVVMLGAFRFAGARPDGAGVRVRFVPGTPRPEVLMRSTVDRVPYCSLAGYDELGFLFGAVGSQLTAAVHRPLSESAMVALARDAILDTAQHTNLVGGPVHVVVLDGTGARFLTKG